jgi:hypothetical protein
MASPTGPDVTGRPERGLTGHPDRASGGGVTERPERGLTGHPSRA